MKGPEAIWRLFLASNWDLDLPARTADYGTSVEFYGRPPGIPGLPERSPRDSVGQTEFHRGPAPSSWQQFADFVAEAQKHGQNFTCRFDSPFMDTLEFDLKMQERLQKFFVDLLGLGVTRVLLGNPYLMDLCARWASKLDIIASWTFRFDNPLQAKHTAAYRAVTACIDADLLIDRAWLDAVSYLGGVPPIAMVSPAMVMAGLRLPAPVAQAIVCPCPGDSAGLVELAEAACKGLSLPSIAEPLKLPARFEATRRSVLPAGKPSIALSAGTNWDPELLVGLPKEGRVADLFGSLPTSTLGGGRPSRVLPDIGREEAARHMGQVRKQGLGFSYVMNAPDMWGKEHDADFKRRFLDEVEWAANAGANQIILSLIPLIKLVKKTFPQLQVKAGSALHTGSVEQAVTLDDLGVDLICLHPSQNRDFALLNAITARISAGLEVIADVHCVLGCPFSATLFHSAACAVHSSDVHRPSPRQANAATYCTSWCQEAKLRDITDLVRYPFVRPEDQEYYTRAGVAQLKLATRPLTTHRILTKMKAYQDGRYDGNLLDIINVFPSFMPTRIGQERSKGAREDGRLQDPFGWGNRIEDVVYIDNRKLDGLLDRFPEQACAPGCFRCRYCHEFARRAVTIHKEAAKGLAKRLSSYRENLVLGGQEKGG